MSRYFPHAIEIARRSGAKLHLVRVVESLWTLAYPASPYDGATRDPYVIQELDEQLTREALAYLGTLSSMIPAEGIDVTSDVVRGRPVDEIIFTATQVSVGFIVTTSHGRGGISRMFHGSVATGLMSHSSVLLMVIPTAPVEPKTPIRYEPERVILL